MASVTTMVVISSLSAAGSRMLPSTVPMLYLRASHPSTCEQWSTPASVARYDSNAPDLRLQPRREEPWLFPVRPGGQSTQWQGMHRCERL